MARRSARLSQANSPPALHDEPTPTAFAEVVQRLERVLASIEADAETPGAAPRGAAATGKPPEAHQLDVLRAAAQYRDELLSVFQQAAEERLTEIERRGQVIAELEQRLADVIAAPDGSGRAAAAEAELEETRADLGTALERIQALEAAIAGLRAECSAARSDAAESRAQYEVVARELIIGRHETLWQHLMRIWRRSMFGFSEKTDDD